MIEILFLFANCLAFCILFTFIVTYAIQTSTFYLLPIPIIIIGIILVSYCLWRAYTIYNSKEYKEQKNRYKVLTIKKHIRKIKFGKRETK